MSLEGFLERKRKKKAYKEMRMLFLLTPTQPHQFPQALK